MHKNWNNSYDNKKRIWLNYTCTISVVVQCIVVLSPIRKLCYMRNYFIKITPQSITFSFFFFCLYLIFFCFGWSKFCLFLQACLNTVWSMSEYQCTDSDRKGKQGHPKRKNAAGDLRKLLNRFTLCCYLHEYNQADVFGREGALSLISTAMASERNRKP